MLRDCITDPQLLRWGSLRPFQGPKTQITLAERAPAEEEEGLEKTKLPGDHWLKVIQLQLLIEYKLQYSYIDIRQD